MGGEAPMKLLQTIEETFSPSIIDVDRQKVIVGKGCNNTINAIGSLELSTYLASGISADGNLIKVTVEIWGCDA